MCLKVVTLHVLFNYSDHLCLVEHSLFAYFMRFMVYDIYIYICVCVYNENVVADGSPNIVNA